MAQFTIYNSDVLIGVVESETPELAAVAVFEGAFRRPYEVQASHGPNWGNGSARINGNGAENLDYCADVYIRDRHVARVEMREIERDRD